MWQSNYNPSSLFIIFQICQLFHYTYCYVANNNHQNKAKLFSNDFSYQRYQSFTLMELICLFWIYISCLDVCTCHNSNHYPFIIIMYLPFLLGHSCYQFHIKFINSKSINSIFYLLQSVIGVSTPSTYLEYLLQK